MVSLRSAIVIASAVVGLVAEAMLLDERSRPSVSPSVLASQVQQRAIPPSACPITQPPSEPFVPPAPYPTELWADGFWLGSEKLWTMRRKGGIWRGYWVLDPESGVRHEIYFDKVFWWRKGYDWKTENPPELRVTGKRLDAPASLFHVNHANPVYIKIPAMLTGIDIPTVGCWQITGDYKGDKLSFVVWVVP
jgi:hypothetical protein